MITPPLTLSSEQRERVEGLNDQSQQSFDALPVVAAQDERVMKPNRVRRRRRRPRNPSDLRRQFRAALEWAAQPGGLVPMNRAEVQAALGISQSRTLELLAEGRLKSARRFGALGWWALSCCVVAEREGDFCERCGGG